MIVLSAGMLKAGTSWYFNLTNDLLVAAGFEDVRVMRAKFHLQSILQFQNCYVGTPTLPKLAVLAIPHCLGYSFPVKTHTNPLSSVQYLMKLDVLRATFMYRDPRDAVVSAFDFGQKIRARLPDNPLAKLNCLEDGIPLAKQWVFQWERWSNCAGALMVRYEDLVVDSVRELERLAAYLSLDVPTPKLEGIVAKYHQLREQRDFQNKLGLHFNKGEVGRFRRAMNQAQLEMCNASFGEYVEKMGYAA
jgi:hypothetical protein